MARNVLKRRASAIDSWANRVLSHPNIDENTLMLKKSLWYTTVASNLFVAVMTLVAWLLDMPILVLYGLFIIISCIPAIVAIPFMRRNVTWVVFIPQIVIIIGTCFFMIKLGGLLHSAGLIFTGISILLLSLNQQNTKMTISLFATYLLSLIITASLEPRLTVAPEITPNKNLIILIANFSWQAGFTITIIINYINQKKKIAEVRQTEAKRLRKLDEAKSKLFTNITHEFRTPLTIILGMAKLIKDNPNGWANEGTSKIKRNGEALLHLVNQMLDLLRLEAGTMPLHTCQQDVIIYLKYLIESFSSIAVCKNITLKISSNIPSLLMDFDSEKLSHIISNLLCNALKFTHERGMIEIVVEKQTKDTLSVSVIDNGIGIDKGHIPLIFNRFYKIENNKNEGGSGLGLALTQELVKLMRGSISVTSEFGRGSTFKIILPITNNAA